MPSVTSFGVEVNRSNAVDFWPGRGGARSPGIVSVAPGWGTCWYQSSVVKQTLDYSERILIGRQILENLS